jgi:hypothetical protein
MKKLLLRIGIITAISIMSLILYSSLQARDMIYTYWHQLDGPYWI